MNFLVTIVILACVLVTTAKVSLEFSVVNFLNFSLGFCVIIAIKSVISGPYESIPKIY